MAIVPQNFIRLTNDILLVVENSNEYQNMNYFSHDTIQELEDYYHDETDILSRQWVINDNTKESFDRLLVTDFRLNGKHGVLNSIFTEADSIIPVNRQTTIEGIEVAKVTILLRQNMQMYTDGSFGILLQLLNRFQLTSNENGYNNVVSQLFPFRDFTPIAETMLIDGNFWNMSHTFYVPFEFFKSPEKTMFAVDVILSEDIIPETSVLEPFLFISTYKNIFNGNFAKFMEFMSKQDVTPPSVDSVIQYDVNSGMFGFSLKTTDETISIEQNLKNYFNLRESDINTQIDVEYNIIFGEVPLQNEDNLNEVEVQDILYAKNYKVSNAGNPLLTTWIGLPINLKTAEYIPPAEVRYFMIYVQTKISVGQRSFYRTNQIIFDFHNVNLNNQQIIQRVLEQQNDPIFVNIENNYEIRNTVIENKTQIETIKISQPIISEMITNETWEYSENKNISFKKVDEISNQLQSYKNILYISKYEKNNSIIKNQFVFNGKQDVENNWYFDMSENPKIILNDNEVLKFAVENSSNTDVKIILSGNVTV